MPSLSFKRASRHVSVCHHPFRRTVYVSLQIEHALGGRPIVHIQQCQVVPIWNGAQGFGNIGLFSQVVWVDEDVWHGTESVATMERILLLQVNSGLLMSIFEV